MRKALILMACLAAATPLAAQATQPQPGAQATAAELAAEQWREDLRFMMAELKSRHANPYHRASEAKLDAAAAELDRRIPTLQRNQVIVELMRIAAMVGDGHTRIDPRKDEDFRFRSLPLKLYRFDDGLYVRAATPAYRELVGAKVQAIGGIPIAEAIRRTSEIVSTDTMTGPWLFVPLYLGMPDILQALGLSDSRDSATLTLSRNGKTWTARVPAGEVAPKWPDDTDISLVTPDGWVDARTAPQPLWLQDPLDVHRLVDLPQGKALYAQLNMVANEDDETLKAFGEKIVDQAKASNPRAVILDLRLNQGGYGDLRNSFIPNLIRTEDSDTQLLVLVGRATFSASQFILDDLDRLTDAVFVGEPASSRPTSYGDAFRTNLPNSKIDLRTSIKYWQSGQDMRPFTPIDIAAPLAFADYAAGRDPALEAALAHQKGANLTDRLEAAAKAGGPASAAQSAKAYVDDPQHRYRDVERELIIAEQVLLSRKQPKAAIEVARWAATRFPRNSDLALILAYVANEQGLKDEARRAIAASLAIDPSNRSAQSLKEKIEGK